MTEMIPVRNTHPKGVFGSGHGAPPNLKEKNLTYALAHNPTRHAGTDDAIDTIARKYELLLRLINTRHEHGPTSINYCPRC
jgi:hypothetical protein